MLKEGESEHRHERMTVKTLPGSPLEVVEAEFFFQLLMRFAAVRVRAADGPPQRIRDKGQQHLPGDEALTGVCSL